MIFFSTIFNFFKNLDAKVLAFIGGAVLVLFMMQQCNRISNLKEQVKQSERDAANSFNNYLAAKDSVTYFKNELGGTVAQISSYTFKISELEKANLDLKERYIDALKLNKDLKGVTMLLYTEIKIKDSLLANTKVTDLDSLTGFIEFNKYDDFSSGNTRFIMGSLVVKYDPELKKFTSFPANVVISQTLSLSAAVEEIDGRNRLKITSAYPGLVITKIENINLIDDRLNNKEKGIDKKSGFSVGMGVGYGINLNTTNSTVMHGPTINVGVYWSPAWLRF